MPLWEFVVGVVGFLVFTALVVVGATAEDWGLVVLGATAVWAMFYGGQRRRETYRLARRDTPEQGRLRWFLAVCEWLFVTGFTAWIFSRCVAATDPLTPVVLGVLWFLGIKLIRVLFAPRAAFGFAPPPRPDPPPPGPPPVLPQAAPAEPFFGEVSEEASRFWSRPHPRLLHAGLLAVGILVPTAGIVGGVLLYEELGTAWMLAIIVGSLALAAVVAVWLSRRYEIPLDLPPRPPPDPRNAPDQASFRLRVPFFLWLFVLPLALYSALVPVLVFAGPDPVIKAEDAPMWLASAGIVLALAVAASVRMFRMRIDIDDGGLSVTNFWSTRVIPWESVRAIRMNEPRWAGPVLHALAVGTAAAGGRGPGEDDVPSGLRIFFSDSEHAATDSISVSATLSGDPQRDRRYQEALATLVKQVRAHGLAPEDPGPVSRERG
jgi:Bacterial PH domain